MFLLLCAHVSINQFISFYIRLKQSSIELTSPADQQPNIPFSQHYYHHQWTNRVLSHDHSSHSSFIHSFIEQSNCNRHLFCIDKKSSIYVKHSFSHHSSTEYLVHRWCPAKIIKMVCLFMNYSNQHFYLKYPKICFLQWHLW